jgi:hypothetical protein
MRRRCNLVGGRDWRDVDTDGGTAAVRSAVSPRTSVVARMDLAVEQAWRLLTNNYGADEHGAIRVTGDPEIIDVLTHTRSIIGTPK